MLREFECGTDLLLIQPETIELPWEDIRDFFPVAGSKIADLPVACLAPDSIQEDFA